MLEGEVSCLEEDIEALAVTSRFLTLCNIAPVLGNIKLQIYSYMLYCITAKDTEMSGKILNNKIFHTLKTYI